MVTSPRFDLHALFVAVDEERRARGLSWSGAANDIGVATSTIRRYRVADDAEADGVLAVLCWLGAAPEAFIEGVPGVGQPLQKPRSGYVRVDMGEVVRATGHRRAGDNRTRTTIQRLVESAQLADQSVASLTRVSEV